MDPVTVATRSGPPIVALGGAFMLDDATTARGAQLGLDDTISPSTLETTVDFATVAEDQRRQIHELGGYYSHLLEFGSYPHIVLSRPPHVFTSFHLALRKRD